MDPVAHTFVGGALAAAGLRRATPLATAALLIGANLPDVDGLAYFAGEYTSVAFRRGWTHGVLAMGLWPPMLAGLLLLWDRHVRLRRGAGLARARAGPLLAVSALAIWSHPSLDWLNNYGLRWLMPFDGTWFYGDALFIIDPWLWLGLGGVLFLRYSAGGAALGAWAIFGVAASGLVITTGEVPWLTRAAWIGGIGLLVLLRFGPLRSRQRDALLFERPAQAVLAALVIYMSAALLADIPARQEIRAHLKAVASEPIEAIMVAPAAGNPFAGDVVVQTPTAYYLGDWQWLRSQRLRLAEAPLERPNLRDPVYAAAAGTVQARRFLTWSRFPYIEVEAMDDGARLVRFRDARYRDRTGLAGPTVRLDGGLQATVIVE